MCLGFAVRTPERVLGEGEHCGLKWAVVHNGMGFRCGYVRVPEGHPLHGVSYGESPELAVHGGLTFSEPDVECGNGNDGGWWFGFDCAHYLDAPDPALSSEMVEMWRDGTVRTQEYVVAECERLAEQLAVMATQ